MYAYSYATVKSLRVRLYIEISLQSMVKFRALPYIKVSMIKTPRKHLYVLTLNLLLQRQFSVKLCLKC